MHAGKLARKKSHQKTENVLLYFLQTLVCVRIVRRALDNLAAMVHSYTQLLRQWWIQELAQEGSYAIATNHTPSTYALHQEKSVIYT